MHRVVLFSRPGCHLCDVAREVLLEARQRTPFAFEEVDIERDDDLELEYGIRIPVVEVDGEERFEITVDPHQLAELLDVGRS
ncbi:MAG TPA: glutaredoxin family protein [Actinomycetota bacterium]|jgi:glutaredoxin|nr:glutaredoxin family protein [Actinomycetota bacterium]